MWEIYACTFVRLTSLNSENSCFSNNVSNDGKRQPKIDNSSRLNKVVFVNCGGFRKLSMRNEEFRVITKRQCRKSLPLFSESTNFWRIWSTSDAFDKIWQASIYWKSHKTTPLIDINSFIFSVLPKFLFSNTTHTDGSSGLRDGDMDGRRFRFP